MICIFPQLTPVKKHLSILFNQIGSKRSLQKEYTEDCLSKKNSSRDLLNCLKTLGPSSGKK